MNRHSTNCRSGISTRQKGFAFMVVLLLVVVASAGIFYNLTTPSKQSLENDEKTNAVLAQAKEALIGYALDVSLSTGNRLGDLPCPDRNNDGLDNDGACLNASGSTLGRLPWKTLGLPDLRDSAGERLWYAVSVNFKNNPRTAILNSETPGTISIRDKNGNLVNDGTNPDPFTPSGVIAVVFAPGSVLQRQGAAAPQERSCAGDSSVANCNATNVCTGPTYTTTALCNPVNYLDVVAPPVLTVVGATGSSEDNAVFTDSVTTDGFISGDIRDSTSNLVVNDRLLTVTYSNLIPLLERRVAKEAFICLSTYAADSQNKGRYPWAAPMNGTAPSYTSTQNTRFGRIPDDFGATVLGIGGPVASFVCPIPILAALLCMKGSWTAACTITTGSWWANWKEQVFYGIADANKPADPLSFVLALPASSACGSCLTVNPPSSAANKRLVVMVAGKRLSPVAGGQPRTSNAQKSTVANYLEADNAITADDLFTQLPSATTINDYLLYQ